MARDAQSATQPVLVGDTDSDCANISLGGSTALFSPDFDMTVVAIAVVAIDEVVVAAAAVLGLVLVPVLAAAVMAATAALATAALATAEVARGIYVLARCSAGSRVKEVPAMH